MASAKKKVDELKEVEAAKAAALVKEVEAAKAAALVKEVEAALKEANEKEKNKEKLVKGKMRAEAGMKYHNKSVAVQYAYEIKFGCVEGIMTDGTFCIVWNNHNNFVYWEKNQVESGMKLYELLYEQQRSIGNDMELGSTDDPPPEKEDGAAISTHGYDDEEDSFGIRDDDDDDDEYKDEEDDSEVNSIIDVQKKKKKKKKKKKRKVDVAFSDDEDDKPKKSGNRKVPIRPSGNRQRRDVTCRTQFDLANHYTHQLCHTTQFAEKAKRKSSPIQIFGMFAITQLSRNIQDENKNELTRTEKVMSVLTDEFTAENPKKLGKYLHKIGKEMMNGTGKGYAVACEKEENYETVWGKRNQYGSHTGPRTKGNENILIVKALEEEKLEEANFNRKH